jgi:hypothetical protein
MLLFFHMKDYTVFLQKKKGQCLFFNFWGRINSLTLISYGHLFMNRKEGNWEVNKYICYEKIFHTIIRYII